MTAETKTVMFLPLSEWAALNAVVIITARTYAQQGKLAGAQKIDNRWLVPITTKPPTPGKRGKPVTQRRMMVVPVDFDNS